MVGVDGVSCFHSNPPAGGEALAGGVGTIGMVVCAHVFGVGVYLAEFDTWGHVNTPALTPAEDGKFVLPAIGERLPLRVLGYSGTGQLRLAARDVSIG